MSQTVVTIVATAIIAFLLGAIAVWVYKDHQAEPDPFEAVEQRLSMGSPPVSPSLPAFGSWPTLSRWLDAPLSPTTGLEASSNKDGFQFRLATRGQTLKNLDVRVNAGQLVLEADLATESSNRLSRSSIRQSFPLPDGADPASLRVEETGDAIVIYLDRTS